MNLTNSWREGKIWSNRADLDPHSTVNTHWHGTRTHSSSFTMLSAHTTVLSLFKQRGNDSFSNGNWRPVAIVSLCPLYLLGCLTSAVTHPGRAWLPSNAVIVYWYLAHSMNTIYFGMLFVFKAGTNRIFTSFMCNIKYKYISMENWSFEVFNVLLNYLMYNWNMLKLLNYLICHKIKHI